MTALHERIRSDIESQILSGDLAPGDRLPIERDLMKKYDCSRMTVSKAISALAAAGIVERRRKAGSFVSVPHAHAMVLDIPDLAHEVRERGDAYRFRLIHREICDDDTATPHRIAGSNAAQLDGPLLMTIGIHLSNDRPFAYEIRTVSLTVVPEIDNAVFDPDAPGTWLLKHVPWTEAETHISAAAANELEARYLEIAENSPCLVLNRKTWRGDNHITAVRQLFIGNAYSLSARFGAAKQ